MVLDFGEFKRIVREEVARFDHMFLVEEGSLAPETVACLQREGFTLKMLPFRTTGGEPRAQLRGGPRWPRAAREPGGLLRDAAELRHVPGGRVAAGLPVHRRGAGL
jgi:hypothetical protein